MLRFSRPEFPEKTLEQIEELLDQVRTSKPRPVELVARVHKLAARIEEDVQQKMVERYLAGASATSISAEFGVSTSAVLRMFRTRGVEIRPYGLSPEMVNRAIELYESGLGVHKVASQLSVSKTTLLRESCGSEGCSCVMVALLLELVLCHLREGLQQLDLVRLRQSEATGDDVRLPFRPRLWDEDLRDTGTEVRTDLLEQPAGLVRQRWVVLGAIGSVPESLLIGEVVGRRERYCSPVTSGAIVISDHGTTWTSSM